MGSNEEERKQHVFTWKIENFSVSTKKKGEVLLSPTFKAKSFDETAWFIKLYPRGSKDSLDGHTSCFLTRREDDEVPLEIECDFTFEIINKNGISVKCDKMSVKFSKGKSFGFSNFMKTPELTKTALNNDTLTIRCTLCGNTAGKNIYSQNKSVTKFKINKHSFQWAVNILKSNNRQEVVQFPCSGSSQVEISITVPKDGDTDNDFSSDSDEVEEADVKVCILIKDSFSCSRCIECNFTMLDFEGKERDSRRATHLFENAETWAFPSFFKMSQIKAKKNMYLRNACFTLKCDFIVSDGSLEERKELPLAGKLTTSDRDTMTDLNEDIRRLHVDKTFTDVKLKVDEQIFAAHKCILHTRSPVFFAMVTQVMPGSEEGEINITDLDAKTMDLFLEYIYTGTVNGLDCENALKLIVAADKYKVLSLKSKCAELLASKLSDANVCKILVTADLVRQDTLKTFIFHYIKMQPDKVFNSGEWQQCVKDHLELATETICEVSRLWGNQTNE